MKKWPILVIALVLVGATLYGGYQWEQHRLSGGFKHIMLALFDPTITNADVSAYVHDARLAAKTPKDHHLLVQMEALLALRVKAAEKQHEASLSAPSDLVFGKSKEELRIEANARTADARVYDFYMKESRVYADQADNLEKSIRSELDLPSDNTSSPR